MGFKRRLASINTEKHYVHVPIATIGLGALTSITVANAIASRVAASDVREGAKITSVYIEMWMTSDDGAQGSTNVSLEKRSGGSPIMTFAQSNNLGAFPNKKNLFYVSQGLTPPNVQSGIPLLRGWFKMPKGKQRFGLNDILVLNISGISNGTTFCGFFTYKEEY